MFKLFTKKNDKPQKERKCPKCLGEVPSGATKCKHCGSKLPLELTKSNVIATVIVIFFVIWAVVSCSKSVDEAAKQPKDPKDTARTCAKYEVKAMLKSPKSAEFPWDMNINMTEDGKYAVLSYVDSQNSFGAMLRTNFLCTVKVLDVDNFKCETKCIFNE